MESKTNKTKSSVSAWFSSKPEGNRPNISAMIELTPEIVNTIVRNGEIGSHEMIQLRLACWKQPAQGISSASGRLLTAKLQLDHSCEH